MTRLVPRKSLLVLGLLVSVLGLPAAAAAAAVHQSPGGHAAVAAGAAAHQSPAGHAAVTTAVAEPGGVCSVPGIGDIGNLLSLCHGGGITGDLNNICQPSLPEPEPADGGIDSLIRPPGASVTQGRTLYDNYGVAGQFWAATGLQCSDMTSLIGNNVAGMVFDAAKAIDRLTITVYQAAAGNGILNWLAAAVNRLITSLGNAIYFPYLAPVVLLGVLWLAWHGLIRKRATAAVEGTIWMVLACAAAIWLIGRPADFTGVGQSVSNGVTQVLNVAFAKLPAPGGSGCVPVRAGDPQGPPGAGYGFTQGNGLVDQDASELWTVLVCKPWLDGEFGTSQFATGQAGQGLVNSYGRQLLWAQAIAANEHPTAALIKAKQSVYAGIAASIKQKDPATYPLFQGDQWTSRLEIGFAALFAALVAGVLVLLIAITLIMLKLGFLLLLVAGPFFLIVGTHPGFGRVVAVRWVEMIIGVLLKQVAVALVLSILLYAYSLIMGTSDAVLPWALKILMIALVTIAVFIYRKPFQHLFSAVGYGSVGARQRAEIEIFRSREVLRRGAVDAAALAATGYAGYRAGRWSRRGGAASAVLADQEAAQAAVPDGYGPAGPEGHPDRAGPGGGAAPAAGARAGHGEPGRGRAAAGTGGSPQSAPPLHLPQRASRRAAGGPASGWARGGTGATGTAHPRGRASDAPPRPAPARHWPARPRLVPRPGLGGVPPAVPARGGRFPSAAAAPPAGGGSGAAPAGPGRHLWQREPAAPATGWTGSTAPPAQAPPRPRQQAAPPVPAGAPLRRPSGFGGPPLRRQPPAGRDEAAGGNQAALDRLSDREAPAPFWLRPVRRKK